MTAFLTWAHRVASGGAQQTLPARLGAVKNVKDFGAKGDFTGDDSGGIQAAIDAAAQQGGATGGTVVIPSGAYRIGAPLRNDNAGTSVSIKGSGMDCTRLEGIAAPPGSYIIDTNGATGKIEEVADVGVINYTGAGAVRMTGTDGATLRDMTLGGGAGLDASGSNRITCYNIRCGTGANNTGYYTGDNTTLINCNGMGLAVAVQACGKNLLMMGCRTETNTVSLVLGKDRNGSVSPISNFSIYSHTTERNRTAIEFWSAHNGIIAGCLFQGTHGITQNYVLSASWSGGVASITSSSPETDGYSGTPSNHGLTIGQAVRIDDVWGPGFNHWVIVTGTPTLSRFTYSIANPGAASITPGFSSWTEMQYNGFNIPVGGRVSNVMVAGININAAVYIGCLNLANMNAADSMTFTSIAASPAQAGNPLGSKVIFPTTPCRGLVFLPQGDIPFGPVIRFADLPGSPVEGMEFNVEDANLAGKTWGDAITVGGSSGHTLLHRNASAWTLEGI